MRNTTIITGLMMLVGTAFAQTSPQTSPQTPPNPVDISNLDQRVKALEDKLDKVEEALSKVVKKINANESEEISLAQANRSQDEILAWSKKSILEIYSYDFNNYQQVLAGLRRLFTVAGYDSYMKALEESKNLATVQEKKLVVSAKTTGKGTIVSQGATNDIYTWTVEVPVEITYKSSDTSFSQNLLVNMEIARVKFTVNPDGIAIHNITAKVAAGKSTSDLIKSLKKAAKNIEHKIKLVEKEIK